MDSFIIQLTDLKKYFKDVKAVDGVTLSIKQGEIFGLLGPNGAGKTTILNILCTLLKPTSGNATIANHDIKKEKDAVRRTIGIVFQDPSLDDQLTAYENLDLHGRLYHVPKTIRRQKMAELLELVELSAKKNVLVKNFSGGMKRRLEIARGLLHQPQVLFLDEPTRSLDIPTAEKLHRLIKEELQGRLKRTIFFTTHSAREAVRLADRLSVLVGGRITFSDRASEEKLEELLHQADQNKTKAEVGP